MRSRSRTYQKQTAENALQIAIGVIDDARQQNQALIVENRKLRREKLALMLIKDEPLVAEPVTEELVSHPEVR